MAGKPTFNPEVEKPKEEEDEGGEGLPPKIEKPEEEEEEEEKEEEEEEKEERKEEDKDIEEKDIPIRKSVQQHIIARQQKTIKKLRSKEEEEGEPETPEIPEEDDLSPEAKTAVMREVRKAIDPVIGQLVKKTDEDELQELFGTDPNSQKYEKRIRSYMRSSDWKGVPPSAIYHHLAFDDAEASGVKRKKVADTESNLNKGGGRQIRPKANETGNIPSVEEQEDMTDEEIEKLQNKVLQGDFIK